MLKPFPDFILSGFGFCFQVDDQITRRDAQPVFITPISNDDGFGTQ